MTMHDASPAAPRVWQPHTRRPSGPEMAVIAIRPPVEFADDADGPLLLAELYRWDERWQCWMSEGSGLKIHHAVFWWMSETDVLQGLPS